MLGWERNPHTCGKVTCTLLLDPRAKVRSPLLTGFSPCSMPQAGPFLGQSPSRLPHKCAPRRLFYNPCRPHLWPDHLAVHRLFRNLEAFLGIPCHTLLWGSHSASTLPLARITEGIADPSISRSGLRTILAQSCFHIRSRR